MSHTRLFCDFLSSKGFLSETFEYICSGHLNYVYDKHLNRGTGCFFNHETRFFDFFFSLHYPLLVHLTVGTSVSTFAWVVLMVIVHVDNQQIVQYRAAPSKLLCSLDSAKTNTLGSEWSFLLKSWERASQPHTQGDLSSKPWLFIHSSVITAKGDHNKGVESSP